MSSWDVVMQENSSSKTEVEFVKTPVGVTLIRLLDEEPKVIWKHWLQSANNGKGMSVVCIGQDKCPVCKANAVAQKAGLDKKFRVSMAFAMNALVIEDGIKKVKVFEKSKSIFQMINEFRLQLGDLINYDLNVKRTGATMQDTKYVVMPVFTSKPLDEETLEEVNAMKIDLDEVYKALTPEQISTLMEGGTLKQETTEGEDLDLIIED